MSGSYEDRQLVRMLNGAGPLHRILEIGVHEGDTLRLWAAFNPKLLIGIDTNPDTFTRQVANSAHAVRIIGFSQEIHTLNEVRELLGPEMLDFLYIDGDHTFDAVRADWDLYTPLVRNGGIVALDDSVITWNPTVDVHRFLRKDHGGLDWPKATFYDNQQMPSDPNCTSTGVTVFTVQR